MTIKELKDLLSKYDENLPIEFVTEFTEHCCENDGYCYCTAEDYTFSIGGIAKEEVYDKNTKKHILKKILIRGDRN